VVAVRVSNTGSATIREALRQAIEGRSVRRFRQGEFAGIDMLQRKIVDVQSTDLAQARFWRHLSVKASRASPRSYNRLPTKKQRANEKEKEHYEQRLGYVHRDASKAEEPQGASNQCEEQKGHTVP
jgi:hypothetical protein